MPFGTSTGWAKWAFVIMCIAPILFIVGFATNYWMQNDSTTVTSVGLWKAQTCTSGTCDTQSVPSSYKNGEQYYLFDIEMEIKDILIIISIYILSERGRERDKEREFTRNTSFTQLVFFVVFRQLY